MTINQDLRTHWAMSPIYYIVRIFALAPYSIVADETKTYWKVTKLSVLYNLITMLCTSISLVLVLLYQIHFLDKIFVDTIGKISDYIRRWCVLGHCFLCMLLSFINRHKICKLMGDMDEFDREISCIGITFNYKSMHRDNAISMIIIYSMIILVWAIDLVDLIQIMDSTFYLYWMYFVLICTANFSTVIQFVGFVHMISTRFVALNKFITELVEATLEKTLTKTNTWSAKQGHKMTIGSCNETKIIDSKQNYINIVCAMHYRLCDMGKELNAMYSIQILLTTGLTFIDLLIRLYRLYLILTSNNCFEMTIIQLTNRITLAIMFSEMTILLSFFCSKIKTEANKSTILLHQTNFEDDDGTRASVVMFYLQMFHQKMEFLAGGFFPVDSSVLYMVVGTITTYLVILIQFQMAAS